MRPLFILVILFSTIQSFGQNSKDVKCKPISLEETFTCLNQIFDDTSKYGYMILPEDVATGRLYNSLGMWIRNEWGLWNNSKLRHYFIDKGIWSPEEMSTIILTSYHRYLNNEPIELEKQIKWYQNYKKAYSQQRDSILESQKYIENFTSDSALLDLFPVGDTILTYIYADYKKWFTSYASSVKAIAVVKGHIKESLIIEIISIEKENKFKPNKKIGETYKEFPRNCSPLPPKGWVFQKPK